jgi:hypothetical protein
VNVVGIQTQVQLYVGAGQPALAEQIVRLREGAAFAMLHTVGLDSIAPPWVVAGMAATAGRAGLREEAVQQAAALDKAARFGGQQWRYSRSAPDQLDDPPLDHEEAASRMAFLLTGNDARLAPAVFVTLRQAGREAEANAAVEGGFSVVPGDAQPPRDNSRWDQLLAVNHKEYLAWKENPHRGQPLFEPQANVSPDVLAAEREMLVLLKLQQRLSGASETESVGRTGPKLVEFKRDGGAVATRPGSTGAFRTSLIAFAERLLDPRQPAWATIDSDGSLLLSTDVERVKQLLSPRGGQYSFERRDGKDVLVLRTDRGRTIRGWLDENDDDKSRPRAKFEVLPSGQAWRPAPRVSSSG